jgi:Zn-dependent peptidase ImmA (M78 family)
MRSRDEIVQSTLALLKRHEITGPPVPVERMALDEGIQVVRSAAEWSESGFLLRDGPNTIMGINSRNAPKRQRFTIAHELGHWKLHDQRLIVDQSVMLFKRDEISSQATDDQEIDANRYAAELLMPRDWIYKVASRLKATAASREDFVTTLAREFEVSIEAMGYRLLNLGVLSS